jgi:hypothetical protein
MNGISEIMMELQRKAIAATTEEIKNCPNHCPRCKAERSFHEAMSQVDPDIFLKIIKAATDNKHVA